MRKVRETPSTKSLIFVCDQCMSEYPDETFLQKCYCCYDKDLCARCALVVHPLHFEHILCTPCYMRVAHITRTLTQLQEIYETVGRSITYQSEVLEKELTKIQSYHHDHIPGDV